MRISDWSSDVCSSDLVKGFAVYRKLAQHRVDGARGIAVDGESLDRMFENIRRQREDRPPVARRSEERRVGKSVSVRVDLGGRRIIQKKTRKTSLDSIETST